MSPWVPLHKIQSWRNHHCRDLSKTNLSTSMRVSLLGGKFWKKASWVKAQGCLSFSLWPSHGHFHLISCSGRSFLNLGSVFIVVSSISEISWKRWWTMTNNMFWEVFTCLTQTDRHRQTDSTRITCITHITFLQLRIWQIASRIGHKRRLGSIIWGEIDNFWADSRVSPRKLLPACTLFPF